MSDKKHIDRVFQEKLKDFEVAPSPKVWENIQNTLEGQKEPQNKSYPIWFKFARIAALLLLLLTLGGFIFNALNTPSATKTADTENTNTNSSELNSDNQPILVVEDATSNSELTNSTQNELQNTELDANRTIANTIDEESKSTLKISNDNSTNKYASSKDTNLVTTSNTDANNNTSNTTEKLKLSQSSSLNKKELVSNNSNEKKSENINKFDSNKVKLNNSNKPAPVKNNTPLTNSDGLATNNNLKNQSNSSPVQSQFDTIQQKATNNTLVSATKSNSSEATETVNDANLNKSSTTDKLRAINTSDKNGIVSTQNESIENSTGELDLEKANDLIDTMRERNGLTTNEEEENNQEGLVNEDITKKDSTSIEDAIAQAENIIEEEEEKVNRWQVYTNVAPVYYNTLGKGSHIHEQFVNNPKSGEVNTSYGINVGYALNDKLSVRTGVHSLNLSYDTNNVILYENVSSEPTTNSLRNISFTPTATNANVSFSVLSSDNIGAQQLSALGQNFNAAISQRISYYEVPLELEYRIIDKKLGVNIIGGVSTFILDNNEVFSEFDNKKTLIGEANNITDVSFSTNLGLGIDYRFSKKLKLNIEPTFKYQINAYKETSGNFRPYIVGVYTGLSYKF